MTRPFRKLQAVEGRRGHGEDLPGGGVHRLHVESLVEREHPRGEVRQDGLEVGLGILELLLVPLHRLGGIGDLARHRVERLREDAELVAAIDRVELGVVALGDRARRLGERRQRRGELLREHEGQRESREQREQHGQGEGQAKDLFQPAARQLECLVVPQPRLDQLRVLRDRERHPLQHLQDANVVGDREHVHRNDDTQVHAALADGLDAPHLLLCAHLAQHVGARKVGKQRDGLGARLHDDLAARRHQRRFLDGMLLAQAVERRALDRLRGGERGRHHIGFLLELAQRVFHGVTRELDAAIERFIDPNVEPRLDRALQELEGDRVDQPARDQRHQREHHHQAQCQLRAEDALAELAAQRHELVGDEPHEAEGKAATEIEQQLVVLREELVVRGRHRHQVHQRSAGDDAQEYQRPHWVSVQRLQSEARVQSRDAMAFSWNGLGSCAVSSRMRIDAW